MRSKYYYIWLASKPTHTHTYTDKPVHVSVHLRIFPITCTFRQSFDVLWPLPNACPTICTHRLLACNIPTHLHTSDFHGTNHLNCCMPQPTELDYCPQSHALSFVSILEYEHTNHYIHLTLILFDSFFFSLFFSNVNQYYFIEKFSHSLSIFILCQQLKIHNNHTENKLKSTLSIHNLT